jgi:hypothetical protein
VLCKNICLCDADPSPHLRKQDCLTARMWALDDASGNTSKILAEVPYEQQQQVTAPDLAEAALLTLMVAVMILNDALPGGQIDDAAIPPVIARILSRLAPLLRSAPMAP